MTDAPPTSRPGQLILVTGSTRGIGFGVAAHLVGCGSRVLLHGRDRGRVNAAAARLVDAAADGGVAGGVVADLIVPEQVTR